MNVNPVKSSIVSKGAMPIKQFHYPLNEQYEIFCMHSNDYLDAYITKVAENASKNRSVVAGIGKFMPKGFQAEQLESYLTQITKELADGNKFLTELIKSQFSVLK